MERDEAARENSAGDKLDCGRGELGIRERKGRMKTEGAQQKMGRPEFGEKSWASERTGVEAGKGGRDAQRGGQRREGPQKGSRYIKGKRGSWNPEMGEEEGGSVGIERKGPGRR